MTMMTFFGKKKKEIAIIYKEKPDSFFHGPTYMETIDAIINKRGEELKFCVLFVCEPVNTIVHFLFWRMNSSSYFAFSLNLYPSLAQLVHFSDCI